MLGTRWCLGFGWTVGAGAAEMDPAIEEVLSRVKANQAKIKDMQADIETIIKSTLGEKKRMEQKGHLWIKGESKSKMEITQPLKQITINSGDKMAMINPETGQKFVQDIKKIKDKMGQTELGRTPMDQTKALEYFNLKLKSEGGGFFKKKEIIIEGTPKEPNKFLGKVVFHIDDERHLPVKVEIFNPQGGLVSTSDLEYQKIKDIWVIAKNMSEVKMPNGKMEVEMKFNNVKVNEGIADREFKID
jgi:outer membrane lipoprotein-sorting protein